MSFEKTIDTLIEDVYKLLANGIKITEEQVNEFSSRLAAKLSSRFSEERTPQLSMSNFGKPCERQLWYSIRTPQNAEPLPPQAKFKFLYGDLLEEFILFLAGLAGHRVEGEQTAVVVAGVPGHRDAVLDGTVVDVKSANARTFKRFSEHSLEKDDPFGYTSQLDLYLEAGQDDPLVTNKEYACFLAVDKELGYLCLDKHPRKGVDYAKEADRKRQVLASDAPPPRAFDPVPYNKGGNLKLGVECSYCAFKKTCWPEMRTFLYASGPVFLTKVVKEPDVPEIK
jgi:hypothetical protein